MGNGGMLLGPRHMPLGPRRMLLGSVLPFRSDKSRLSPASPMSPDLLTLYFCTGPARLFLALTAALIGTAASAILVVSAL